MLAVFALSEIANKIQQSKFLKCFLVAVVLVFSYETSKPKAFGPAGLLFPLLVGLAADTLITMGVKAVNKQVLHKQAENYAQQAVNSGAKFDFMGTNPYRNKDGSISLSPSANDRAKMAGLIGGSLAGLYAESIGGGSPSCEPSAPTGGVTLDVREHPEEQGMYPLELKYADKYLHFFYVPAANGDDRMVARSKVTGSYIWDFVNPAVYDYDYLYVRTYGNLMFGYQVSVNGSISAWNTRILTEDMVKKSVLDSAESVAASSGASLGMCADMFIPSTVERVYPAPMDMSSTYKMPNEKELAAMPPIIIYNVVPPSDTEGFVPWSDVEKDYSDVRYQPIIDSNLGNFYDDAVFVNNPYVVDDINNDFTDINFPEKIEDFKPPVGEIVPPVDSEEVSELDHSMWQVMKNTYNYLDDGIDSSLVAMKGITDSASGITNYLGQTMGWLPAEWRAVFTSAFVLGVFAHFLRR